MQTIWVGMGIDQVRTQCMPPYKVEENASSAKRGTVDECCNLDIRSYCKAVLGENCCGERQQGRAEQKHEIIEQEHVVTALDVVKHRVVVDPHHPHLQETERIGQVQWPLLQ